MLLLAIECCFQSSSVAVGTEEKIIDWIYIKEKNMAGKLLVPSIKQLFLKNTLGFENLDAIIVNFGPGSFTGMRIAGMIAKTMSFTLNKKYYGVSSLELLVYNFLQSCLANNQYNTLIPVIDAKSNLVYTNTFTIQKGRAVEKKVPTLINCDELIEYIKNDENPIVITPDTQLVETLYKVYNIMENRLFLVSEPTAIELLKLGREKMENKEKFIYEPLYLRKSYAEEKSGINL